MCFSEWRKLGRMNEHVSFNELLGMMTSLVWLSTVRYRTDLNRVDPSSSPLYSTDPFRLFKRPFQNACHGRNNRGTWLDLDYCNTRLQSTPGTVHLISLILLSSFFVIDGSVAVGFPSTTDPSYRLPPISKSMIPMVAVHFIQWSSSQNRISCVMKSASMTCFSSSLPFIPYQWSFAWITPYSVDEYMS